MAFWFVWRESNGGYWKSMEPLYAAVEFLAGGRVRLMSLDEARRFRTVF